MLLSEADIRRLRNAGFRENSFVVYDEKGYARLRNVGGYCIFYDKDESECKVYRYRPLGCRIYPVIYVEEEGIVIDRLCIRGYTVSRAELKRKGAILKKLLQRIDKEAEKRVLHKNIKKP
jgi:hypothetical protein